MLQIFLNVAGSIEETERAKIEKIIPDIVKVIFDREQPTPYSILSGVHNPQSKQRLIVFTIIDRDSPNVDLVRARAKLETLFSKGSLPAGFKASVELFNNPILFPHH
ncbi:MAG TPA: hypothetical protein VIJ88_00085 [Candidatus Paceibacterota bacterium]